MAKMAHDEFEAWVRSRAYGADAEIVDELCKGELDFASGIYTFQNAGVQAQWEAWQASKRSYFDSQRDATFEQAIEEWHYKRMRVLSQDPNGDEYQHRSDEQARVFAAILEIKRAMLSKERQEQVDQFLRRCFTDSE